MEPGMIGLSIFFGNLRNQQGLTLLEMLVVVFLLSAMALLTVSFTGNADDQFRFEETRTRLAQIRTAVAGRPDQPLNGGPAIGGFVADIGRLPADLRELIEPGTLPAWTFDAGVGLWAGWRGPYVTSLTEQGGLKTYRDGWGNGGSSGSPPNYGWSVAVDQTAGTLTVQSLGSDGAAGGADYAADYPDSAAGSLVLRDDHQINLRGWSVTVTFTNPTNGGSALPSADTTLRLRLYYPEDGRFGWPTTWPATETERDTAPYLSLDTILPANAVPEGGSADLTFQFGSADKFVPWGMRALGVVTDAGGAFPDPDPNIKSLVTLAPRINLSATAMTWRIE
jgi:prepilin-type N-terminal cleavage/methylation domain-containing protein